MNEYDKYYTAGELREKYNGLLKKHQQLMLRESELERTLEQQGAQLEYQNEMIANLLKKKREAVDNSLGVTSNTV